MLRVISKWKRYCLVTKHEEEFTIKQPTAPKNQRSTPQKDVTNQIEIDAYKENVKMFVMRKNRHEENKEKFYSVIWAMLQHHAVKTAK